MAARRVLLVEPENFFSNPHTAGDNFFQAAPGNIPENELSEAARQEFKGLVELLTKAGVEVHVFQAGKGLPIPDAIYPNNWFSTFPDGTFILYPMMAENRRLERRPEIISWLLQHYAKEIDLTYDENRGLYLEGTGSLVIDHLNKIGYASLSQRTSSNMLFEWSRKTGYDIVMFNSHDMNDEVIYHTNVMMTLADGFAIVCKDAIDDEDSKDRVFKSLVKTNHEVIEISRGQMHHFCGNCLELENDRGEKFLIMSTDAFNHFTDEQRQTISRFSTPLHTSLKTIETTGGGGARCMMAEIF